MSDTPRTFTLTIAEQPGGDYFPYLLTEEGQNGGLYWNNEPPFSEQDLASFNKFIKQILSAYDEVQP